MDCTTIVIGLVGSFATICLAVIAYTLIDIRKDLREFYENRKDK